MTSDQAWVVLFGGAQREPIIMSLLESGVRVSAVFVPESSSQKLDASISIIENAGLLVKRVSKNSLSDELLRVARSNLLSIGFPYIVPPEVLNHHAMCLNVHPTLLPKYRGPSSGAYILINGEKQSGSTVHVMTPGIDDGPIVAQSRVDIGPFDTLRSMQRKVYATEPALVLRAIAALEAGEAPFPQDQSQGSTYPKKRTPADSRVDPHKPLAELFDSIRACDASEFPAFFIHQGEKVCIRLWRPEKPAGHEDEI